MRIRIRLPLTLAWLVFCFAAPFAVAEKPPPIPKSDSRTIEYESVAEALEALQQKEGVDWREINGWPVADDEAELAIWSFSPPDYPAYPAVVKRQVVPRGANTSTIVISVACEAELQSCEDLVRVFAEMNGMRLPE